MFLHDMKRTLSFTFIFKDISLVPTLEQQIRQPLLIYNNLLPIKTSLLGRKGVRCRQCEHSLCKNEYNPSSVKFKIQVRNVLIKNRFFFFFNAL